MRFLSNYWIVFFLTLLGALLGYFYFQWAVVISQPAQLYGNSLISTAFGLGLGFFGGLRLREIFRKKKKNQKE